MSNVEHAPSSKISMHSPHDHHDHWHPPDVQSSTIFSIFSTPVNSSWSASLDSPTPPTSSSIVTAMVITVSTPTTISLPSVLRSGVEGDLRVDSSGPTSSQLSSPTQSSLAASSKVHQSLSISIITVSVIGSTAALFIAILRIFILVRRRRARSRGTWSHLVTPLTEEPTNQDDCNTHRREKRSLPATGSSRPPGHNAETIADPQLNSNSAFPNNLPLYSGSIGNMPIETHLASIQNTMIRMAEHMQRLESQRASEEGLTAGRSDAPPTYVSE
ncbi:hypothetical protein GYMLUDRAFT_251874 [Collybiopsis luxurians FD-317 M1]|uniref:Uncharacterized protein n=1 Tax=Collybiopsis luxurians FD-317 M1 TaxID=944289 RepID=A0A0D0AN59_9AGAR|nr:hypothetical protein GYMLUDRAFT_251874 [Collybiopsis luxurians FD-317 M1]